MKLPEEWMKIFHCISTQLTLIEEVQKEAYNQAIDDATENANCIHYFNSAHGCEYSVDKQSILKLKK